MDRDEWKIVGVAMLGCFLGMVLAVLLFLYVGV